jgi:hypothetical protein
MKNNLTFFLAFTLAIFCKNIVNAQCTTTNATSCQCLDGTNNCLLLPDIQASWLGISQNGYTEYPQTGAGTNFTGQGPDDGRLRVTGATPNNGFGPLTVRGLDAAGKRTFLCGTDTFFNVNATGQFACPNGYPNPRQLIIQRVYRKDGNAMSYIDRWAGSQTYHPSHGHNHVDDWAIMTLRIQTADPNPLNWPIVGEGAKIGFCLMDYGQCGTGTGSTYYGFCRDTNMYYQQGDVMLNPDFPNWGLGGGSYGCSVVEQGITAGWLDVYGKHLDGMWINIPPNTCNGDYWIVLEVDKSDNFLEEIEDNNWTAVPVTLTRQLPAATPQQPLITAVGSRNLCSGGSVMLSATGGTSFLWSNGETTQTIIAASAGTYTVTVTNYCGTNVSNPYSVNEVTPPNPTVSGDMTICAATSALLIADNQSNSLVNNWYDASGNWVAYGDTFISNPLLVNTTFNIVSTQYYLDTMKAMPHTNGIGGGGYISSAQYQIFDSYTNFTLRSVLVYSQTAGNITIALQDSSGTDLQTATVTVPAGASRVLLNFNVPIDSKLRLTAKSMTVGGLFRNNNSAMYPYMIDGVLSIIGASAGASFYYYFYDWEVLNTNGSCSSSQTPVDVTVTACSGLSLEDIQFMHEMKLMPNPNNGDFTLNFLASESSDIQLQVNNLLGQQVFVKNLANQTGEITENFSLSHLASGIYLMNVIYKGKSYVKKFVKE